MKKRVMSLLLVLVMVLSLLPTFAAAADANGITNPPEATDETGDLHLTKELSMNNDGTYDVTLKAWATGTVETEIVPEQVPTDFVLVLDQSGSMSTADMPTGFTKVDQTNFTTQNIVDAVNDNDPYYFLAPDGKYYQVHERDAGTYSQLSNIYIYKQNGFFGMGAKDGLTKMETPFVARTNVTGESDGTTEAYYFYKGVYYRLSVYAVGLPLRFQGTPFFTDANGTRHNLKTYTYTWGVADLIINPKITDTIYKKTSTAYRLYYLDENGNAVDIGSQVGNRSTTAYSGDLYKKNADESRLSALQKSVNTFIDTIAAQKNADGSRVDHRVAIVGFASGNQKSGRTTVGSTYYYEVNEYGSSEANIGLNTELFDGATQKNYFSGNLQDADYLAALKSTDQVGVQQLKASVNALEANGATFPNYGLEMAEHVFTSRGEEGAKYTKLDGVTKDNRNMVVVMFTDGVPGLNEYDNQFRAANNVVAEAKNLKDMDAEVYTVGVFSQDDTHPLQYSLKKYDTNTNSYSQTAAEQPNFLYSELETYTNGDYAFTYYMFRGNNTMENNGTDTVGNYMRVTSSDYEDATSFMDSNTPNPNTGITGRGTATYNTHYMRASDTKALENVFKTIATNVSHTSTPVAINSSAVLKDVINLEQFAPGENYSVEAYTVLGTTTNDKDYSFGTTPMETLTPDPNTPNGTISVSGFDYSTHFISSMSGQNGRQLIVKIHGLVPNGDGGTLSSNDGEAKISVTKDDETIDVVKIGTPTVAIGQRTVVMDFGATAVLAQAATGENAKTNLVGASSTNFVNDNSKVTFSYGKTLSGANTNTVDLTVSAVESALVYGKQVTGTDAEGNITTAANPTWEQVNVIPANAVYFDDSIATTDMAFDASGHGYNASVPATGSTAADGSSQEVLTFKFHGDGIDVYCTTPDANGWIQATVDETKQPYTNTRYMGEDAPLKNIPVISFRGLGTGEHTLTIKTLTGANFKLDGIRVYNTTQDATGDDATTVNNAYAAANEQNAVFMQVRQYLLSKAQFESVSENGVNTGESAVAGAVFIDTNDATTSVADYTAAGPKNEVYLASGQGVAFQIKGWDSSKFHVMVGLSVPAGGSATVAASGRTGNKKIEVSSETTMFYDITPDATTGNVYIYNTGDDMVSITDLKITGTEKYVAPLTFTLGAPIAPDSEDGALTVQPMMLMRYVEDFDPEAVIEDPVVVDDPQTPDTPDTPDDGDKPGWDDSAYNPVNILKQLFKLLLQNLGSLFSGLGNW